MTIDDARETLKSKGFACADFPTYVERNGEKVRVTDMVRCERPTNGSTCSKEIIFLTLTLSRLYVQDAFGSKEKC